jgi:hypothetical protein
VIDGLVRVQDQDRRTAKLSFSKASSRDHVFMARCSELLKYFKTLQTLSRTAPDSHDDSDIWCQNVLRMKLDLMISRYDYLIHSVQSGTTFDKSWMVAEDEQGFEVLPAHCVGKTVKMCPFPALIQQSPRTLPMDASIEDVLVKNKRFFPSAEENRAGLIDGNTVVIGKATVLLEGLGKGLYS